MWARAQIHPDRCPLFLSRIHRDTSAGFSDSPSGRSNETATSRMFGPGGTNMRGSPMQDSPSYHMMASCESDGGESFARSPAFDDLLSPSVLVVGVFVLSSCPVVVM